MFGTIRRHQSWLWIIIIVLVIISFVWYMGPSSGSGGGFQSARGGVYGYVNGKSIDRERFMQAYNEARLQFFRYAQTWPENSPAARQMFDAERQVAERLALLDKLATLRIEVDDKAVARWIAREFSDERTGAYNPEFYRQFVDLGLRRGGVTEQAFLQYVRHEIGVWHLVELAGLTGRLVTQREAEQEFRRQNIQVQTSLAVFSASNYLNAVQISPEGLTNFFNAEASRYRVPDKVRVNYVQFPISNYLAQAESQLAAETNLQAVLDAMYLQRGTNSFLDASGSVMTPEAAKAQIRSEQLEALALEVAQSECTAFGEKALLAYETNPEDTGHLQRLAAEAGIPSGVTAPFARFERPPGLMAPATFAQVAFELSPVMPMSPEPLVGQDAVFLLSYQERIEGYVPPLDQVRTQVVDDFRESEARRLAREAAASFRAAAAESLSQKSLDFAAICTNAGITPFTPEPFAPITRSLAGLPAGLSFGELQSVALDLRPGDLSRVVDIRDGAFVTYLVSREPADENRLATELPEFMETLRRERERAARSEWLRKELELAQVSGLPPELRSSTE